MARSSVILSSRSSCASLADSICSVARYTSQINVNVCHTHPLAIARPSQRMMQPPRLFSPAPPAVQLRFALAAVLTPAANELRSSPQAGELHLHVQMIHPPPIPIQHLRSRVCLSSNLMQSARMYIIHHRHRRNQTISLRIQPLQFRSARSETRLQPSQLNVS